MPWRTQPLEVAPIILLRRDATLPGVEDRTVQGRLTKS